MLRRTPRVAKLAVLGLGAVGFAGLAYRAYLHSQPLPRLDTRPQEPKHEEQQEHRHDQDVRVLDMIGLPAVHGANILESDQSKSQQGVESARVELEQQKPMQVHEREGRGDSGPEQTEVQSAPSSKPEWQVNRVYGRGEYRKLSQIPLLDNVDKLNEEEYVLLIIDPGYTSMFENELISKLSKILKNRRSSRPLTIYRVDSQDKRVKEQLEEKYSAAIKEQDIYILRNPYDKQFINIDFDLFLKHDRVPAIYLSELKLALNDHDLKRELVRMTPNDTYLLLAMDSTDQAALAKSKLVAKYIEMELGVESYDNVKLCLVDHKAALDSNIISQGSKPNSLHLIRKNNEFTFRAPNRYLYGGLPYHIIENISLQDKNQKIMIPRYMGKIETFTSLKLDSPYICVINVDRNRISPREERELLGTIAAIKASQDFPNISYVLKFGEVESKGHREEVFANKKWSLKLANVDEIDKHTFMHQIKGEEDAKGLGIGQKNWMRDTFEYLYREPEVTEEGVRNFFQRVLNGQETQFFKSQAKHKLQHVDKLTANNFNDQLFGDGKVRRSHLVFEYSDHCHACQALSPIVEYFADVCSKFPEIGTDVHALNCDRNKVRGQPYSPYTPNLYLYSKNWGNKEPIRYPIIEYVSHTNVWGIYDFCTITDRLAKVDLSKFEEHLKNVTQSRVRLDDF